MLALSHSYISRDLILLQPGLRISPSHCSHLSIPSVSDWNQAFFVFVICMRARPSKGPPVLFLWSVHSSIPLPEKVLLQIQCAWELPGQLMKQQCWASALDILIRRSGIDSWICISNKLPGGADAVCLQTTHLVALWYDPISLLIAYPPLWWLYITLTIKYIHLSSSLKASIIWPQQECHLLLSSLCTAQRHTTKGMKSIKLCAVSARKNMTGQ